MLVKMENARHVPEYEKRWEQLSKTEYSASLVNNAGHAKKVSLFFCKENMFEKYGLDYYFMQFKKFHRCCVMFPAQPYILKKTEAFHPKM
jgi:hypothetical protein